MGYEVAHQCSYEDLVKYLKQGISGSLGVSPWPGVLRLARPLHAAQVRCNFYGSPEGMASVLVHMSPVWIKHLARLPPEVAALFFYLRLQLDWHGLCGHGKAWVAAMDNFPLLIGMAEAVAAGVADAEGRWQAADAALSLWGVNLD